MGHESMNATLIIFVLCFAPVTLQSIEDNADAFYKVGSGRQIISEVCHLANLCAICTEGRSYYIGLSYGFHESSAASGFTQPFAVTFFIVSATVGAKQCYVIRQLLVLDWNISAPNPKQRH